jgi:hypothetical protein
MKSQAVLSDGGGMPGVSGELNVHAVPTRPRCAKEPGVVPSAVVEGFWPSGGSEYERSVSVIFTASPELVRGANPA